MAAGKWKVYDTAKEKIGQNLIDLDTHTFKIALFLSTSDANDLTTNVNYADVTNEVGTAFGYTAGGITLTGVTWNESSGTVTFDCDNVQWVASGGSIVARFAVIYDDTASGKPLLCVCLLDTAPADVTATSGNALGINMNASGVFTLSGATVD